MTSHISADKKKISKRVLMAGDPLRVKFMAEKFLDDAVLVSKVRNMFFYTGYYKGVRVTIAGSGMGNASMGIYSYELFKFYDVDFIIRIGSAGSYTDKLKLGDVFNVSSTYHDSSYPKIGAGIDKDIINSTEKTFNIIKNTAENNNISIVNGNCHSSDVFYRLEHDDWKKIHEKYDVDCVEMESAALFANAHLLNKSANCILTISDLFIGNVSMSLQDRETSFTKMVHLALESIINF